MCGASRLLMRCARSTIVGSRVVCGGQRIWVPTCRLVVFTGDFRHAVWFSFRRRVPEDWYLEMSPRMGSGFVDNRHIGSGDRLDHWVAIWFFDSRQSHSRVALLRWHGWSFCPQSASLSACSLLGIFLWDAVHWLLTLRPATCSVLIPFRHSFKSSLAWQAPPSSPLRAPWLCTHIDIDGGGLRLSVIQAMPSLMAWISAFKVSANGLMLQCPSWIVVVGFSELICHIPSLFYHGNSRFIIEECAVVGCQSTPYGPLRLFFCHLRGC